MKDAMKGSRFYRNGRRASGQNPRAGFTLMETMIAIAILGFGVLNISLMFLTANQQNKTSRAYTNLVALVNDYTERLSGLSRVDATAVFGAFPGCAGVDPTFVNDPAAGPGFVIIDNSLDLNATVPTTGAPFLTAISPDAGPGGQEGIFINYRLYGYCTASRVSGTISPLEPNSYLMIGKAYLVNDINLPAGYQTVASHGFNFIFADRGFGL